MSSSNKNFESAEERGKRVRYIRDRLLGLSREQFCKNSEVTNHSLKAWELAWGGGLTESGAKKLVLHAKSLGVYTSCAWLMHDIGNTPMLITKDFDIHEDEVEQIAKELLVFREAPNSIDMLVKDDAMTPYLYPGDYVGGIISNKIDNAIGHTCIIADKESNYYIRVLEKGEQPEHYNLLSLNEKPVVAKKKIANIQIELAAPIVWIRKPEPKD